MDPAEVLYYVIAAVKKRPCLYDKTLPNYSNRNCINAEWKKGGEEIGFRSSGNDDILRMYLGIDEFDEPNYDAWFAVVFLAKREAIFARLPPF